MQGVELTIPAIDQVLAASFSLHLDHKALTEKKRMKKVFINQVMDHGASVYSYQAGLDLI